MSFQNLSATRLRELASCKEKLVIRYKVDNTDEQSMLLTDTYSKEIGANFSSFIKSALENNTQTTFTGPFSKRVIVIIGGNPTNLMRVIHWTVKSCNGNGITTFLFARGAGAYNQSLLDRDAAMSLDIPFLVNKLDAHIKFLGSKPISSVDLRAVLKRINTTDEAHGRISKIVTEKTWKDQNLIKYTERMAVKARNEKTQSKQNNIALVDAYLDLRQDFSTTLGAEVDRAIKERFAAGEIKRDDANGVIRAAKQKESTTTTQAAAVPFQVARAGILTSQIGSGSTPILWSKIHERKDSRVGKSQETNIKITPKASAKASNSKPSGKTNMKEERKITSWPDEVSDSNHIRGNSQSRH